MATLLILLSVLCSSAAHLLMKIGANGLNGAGSIAGLIRQAISPALIGGAGLHVIALFLWIGALARVEISYAYPFIALGYVLITLAAYILLNESITPLRLLGLAVIVSGVAIVARS